MIRDKGKSNTWQSVQIAAFYSNQMQRQLIIYFLSVLLLGNNHVNTMSWYDSWQIGSLLPGKDPHIGFDIKYQANSARQDQ